MLLVSLGPWLTQPVVEMSMKNISWGLKVAGALDWLSYHLPRFLKTLKEIFHRLQKKATLVGLSIKEHKTKYMQIKRTEIKGITHLKIENFTHENVENFNYLGSILKADNKMNIETTERIWKCNKAYYANAKIIKLKFLKKNTKMKIYKMAIRPVVRYWSETWTVTAKGENNIRIF